MNVICFHNPDEENAYLSNWFYCEFIVEGIKFNSGEQYMMYSKAITMGDKETAQKISQEVEEKLSQDEGQYRGFYDFYNALVKSIVKGHDGHPENERCDRLATMAADGEDLLEDDGGDLRV